MKAKRLAPLTLLQHTLLTALRANRDGLDLRALQQYAEALDPAARLAVVKRRTAAALERLAREQVIELSHVFAEGTNRARAVTRLDAEARACLLLSKPTQERHARKIQGQSEHDAGRATVSNQPTPDSGRAQAVDAGGILGGNSKAENTGPASASESETADAVLETVQIKDPEARP